MNRILIALILPSLVAGTLLACGDDKTQQLTVPEYLHSLEIVFSETAEDTAFLKSDENVEIWLIDLDGTRDLLDRSVPISEETARKLSRLTPPDELAVPHSKLVSSFNTILAGNKEVQTRLSQMTTADELENFRNNELPIPGTAEAAAEFREACAAIEDFGAQTGTTVNLHCNEL